MHHIYHTEGLILGSKSYGETGKYYSIFTRDLGMIYASAQGVRKMSSRLRFVLNDYAYIKLDFVRGKDFWRLTTASKTNMLEDVSKNKGAFRIYVNIARLLQRLLAGEDANVELFDDVLKGLMILEKCKTEDEFRNTEAVIVLRVLHNLGYIGENNALDNVIKSPLEEVLIYEAAKNRPKMLLEINKALSETHL